MDRLSALLRRSVTDPRTDGQLLAAFLTEREEAAFVELVRRHGPLVWGVCRRAFANRTDAEDAFQATFLVLIRRARSLTSSPTVGPWLFKVAAWTVRSHRRKAARFPSLELPTTLRDQQPADVPSDFDAVLLGLPERCRAAVLMCHLEGLTHREVAERLGCAEGTVSSLVSRGLAKLRTKFAGRDPSTVLALIGAAVPATLVDAAVRSATVFQLASFSAAASPAVIELTRGVLRMFWVKKATAVSLAAVMLFAVGLGVGVSVRETPRVVADEGQPLKPVPKTDSRPPVGDAERIELELKALVAQLELTDAEIIRLHQAGDALAEQAKKVRAQRDALAAKAAELVAKAKSLAKVTKDPANPQGPYLAVMVGGDRQTLRFQVTEFDADWTPVWTAVPHADLVDKIANPGPVLIPTSAPKPTAGSDKPGPWRGGLRQAPDPAKERAASVKAIEKYLKRARNDPSAPQTVRLFIEVGATLENVYAAVDACRAAGFTQVRVNGYLPPGCGIGAGKSPREKDTYCDDTLIEVEKLFNILMANMEKC